MNSTTMAPLDDLKFGAMWWFVFFAVSVCLCVVCGVVCAGVQHDIIVNRMAQEEMLKEQLRELAERSNRPPPPYDGQVENL